MSQYSNLFSHQYQLQIQFICQKSYYDGSCMMHFIYETVVCNFYGMSPFKVSLQWVTYAMPAKLLNPPFTTYTEFLKVFSCYLRCLS
jgi:hypothetical protein